MPRVLMSPTMREVLQELITTPKGSTVLDLSKKTGYNADTIREWLYKLHERMDACYIREHVKSSHGAYMAVWVAGSGTHATPPKQVKIAKELKKPLSRKEHKVLQEVRETQRIEERKRDQEEFTKKLQTRPATPFGWLLENAGA